MTSKQKQLSNRIEARAEIKRQRKARRLANHEAEARGESVVREKPRTIFRLRQLDDDIIDIENDEEVQEIEVNDEFAKYFRGDVATKILMTTVTMRPKLKMIKLLKELQAIWPETYYLPRSKMEDSRDIIEFAKSKGYTAIMIFEEKTGQPWGVFISHLPEGPTLHFRLSNITLAEEMERPITTSDHRPELIFKGFSTSIARRVLRGLHALFPYDPEFKGRRLITFLNQHDFIFFRHYRYVFSADGKAANLAEIGPRLTLKLRSVQEGTLDRETGKYEWMWRAYLQKTNKMHYL